MINGLRIKQARELAKLTQTQLAERTGVAQSTIAKMEGTIRDWGEPFIEAIAIQTGFPVSFFRQGLGPEFPLGSLLFRCRASMPSYEKAHLCQLGLLIFEMAEKMAVKTRPIPLHFPILKGESPVEAARLTRATLGLPPDTPIPHLINKLERNGVYVFSIPSSSDKFDAFSLWPDTEPRKPILIIASNRPGDRLRYNVAHELGHLVLHRSPRGALNDIEQEANVFAAEFLLPETAMRLEIKYPVTLISLAKLKPKWGVSIQAFVRRAYDLEIITERQYRYLFEQISKYGWRKKEPSGLDIRSEKPRYFRKLAELSYGNPPDVKRVASIVNAPIPLVESLLNLHADLSEVNGPKKKSLPQSKPEPAENNGKVLDFDSGKKTKVLK